jgi:hypothetical protein
MPIPAFASDAIIESFTLDRVILLRKQAVNELVLVLDKNSFQSSFQHRDHDVSTNLDYLLYTSQLLALLRHFTYMCRSNRGSRSTFDDRS